MNRNFIASAVLICGLAVSAAGLGGYAAARAADAPTTGPAHERHPEMRAALHHLREAKKNLETAKHDYAGHRAAALKLADEAIVEVEAGLASDK